MVRWFCIIVTFLFVITGCGSDETPTRFNTFTPLTSIVITSAAVSLPAGVSTQLIATGNFSGLFTRDITSEVTWVSAQPLTADFPVDLPRGRVKGLQVGVTPITASLDGITGSFNLTVNDAVITALTVAPLSPSCPLGLSQAFTAQGAFTDAVSRDLTKDVTWATTDETVATISNEFAGKGRATTLKMGTTTISAQFEAFAPTSTLLTVTAATLTSIAVTPANPAVLSLSTQTFSAKGTYSDKSTRDITSDPGVTWVSSAPAVAAIAAGNIVNAVTPGTSTISATSGKLSGTSNLKVTGGSLQSIALTLVQVVNGELINGTSSRVTARGTFNNGTSRDITGAVILTDDSANVNVAPVSGNLARVQALGVTPAGAPAKIFAAYGSTLTPGESLLTVTAPPLSSVTISPTTLILANGTSGRLSLTGTFVPPSSQDLTFSADWAVASGTATVGNVDLDKGRVRALAAGLSQITATYGGQTATTTVTVEARTLESLTVSAVTTPATMIAGTEKKFRVMANYVGGISQDVTADAIWSINDLNVANFSDQLSDPGLVVAVDAGTATLTAEFGGKKDTETLVVAP